MSLQRMNNVMILHIHKHQMKLIQW